MKYMFETSDLWNTQKRKLCFIIYNYQSNYTSDSPPIFKVIIIKNICVFSDIDECKGNHSCHVNATCTNTNGSYLCECHPGFNGNGQSCTGEFNLFAIIFRMFLLEPSLRLLRWPLSAISLVSHMLTILVCLKSAWSCSLMRWLRKKELRFGSCWIH